MSKKVKKIIYILIIVGILLYAASSIVKGVIVENDMDFGGLYGVKNITSISIGTTTMETGKILFPDGTVQNSAFSGTISVGNVSSGEFGSNTGGGNYTFPGIVTINGSLDMSGNEITGVSAPTASSDVATKSYVDASGGGLTWEGYTSNTFTGDLGGLQGANQKCDNDYPGSHWMSYEEMMRLGAAYPWTYDVWLRDGGVLVNDLRTNGYVYLIPKDGQLDDPDDQNDIAQVNCQGWTSGYNTSLRGGIYADQYGMTHYSRCYLNRRLGCVSE